MTAVETIPQLTVGSYISDDDDDEEVRILNEARQREENEIDAEMQRKLDQLLTGDTNLTDTDGSPLSDGTGKLVANYSISLQDAPLSSATPTQLLPNPDLSYETQKSIHSKSNVKLRNSLRELQPSDAQKRIVEVLRKGDDFATSGETLLRIVFVKKTLRASQQLLDSYRSLCDQFGIGRLVLSDVEPVLKSKAVFYIPDVHTPTGSSVLWIDIGKCQAIKEKFHADCMERGLLCVLESLMYSETSAARHGVIVIVNMKEMRLSSLASFANLSSSLQNCYPALIKSIVLTDVGSFSSVVMTPFLRLLSTKIRSRIQFIKSEMIIDHVGNLSSIPTEFGGEFQNGYEHCEKAIIRYLADGMGD